MRNSKICEFHERSNIRTASDTAHVAAILKWNDISFSETPWVIFYICIEKKLDGNYSRMLQAILNKSWKEHSMKQQLYSLLPPISKII